MKPEVESTLEKLKQFCLENNCSFIRGENSTNDLILAIRLSSTDFEDIYFAEEISFETLHNKWYTI